MSSVFLSYDRDDTARARPIAVALEKAGHSVWWDRHIKGGAQYSKEIETALKAADAVVVLWSINSVESAWVRDEAAAGRDDGRLVPVLIDGTDPPLGFRQYQAIDLSAYKGRGKSNGLDELLASVAALGGEDSRPIKANESSTKDGFLGSWRRLSAGILVIAALLAGAFAFLKMTGSDDDTQTVAVVAADLSPATAETTRNLMVMLGKLQSVENSSMKLIETDGRNAVDADLIFKAGTGSTNHEANLMLLLGKDRTILWSKDFNPPSGNPSDLKQQLAYTAARVLDCTLEALNSKDKRRLDHQLLKTYLNGCAQVAELIGTNTAEVIPLFTKVAHEAPWFEPGWAKLLMSEISTTDLPGDTQNRVEAALVRKHMAQARQVNPKMVEAALAEISLLPSTALWDRARLIDQSLETEPNNANLLSSRSKLYASVGRLNDAIRDAKRASQLEPLSPAFRHTYISVLSHAGQLAAAFQELENAERLWPGASNMIDARFRLHIFYGDPKEALRLLRKGVTNYPPSIETVLNARIDPSPDNMARAKSLMRYTLRNRPQVPTGPLHGYGQFGISDELFAILDPAIHTDPAVFSVLFRPDFRDFRKDKRFVRLAARFGVVEYWKKSGVWADFCREPDLPYDCKAEATKLAA